MVAKRDGFWILLYFILFLSGIFGQNISPGVESTPAAPRGEKYTSEEESKNPCTKHETCGQCISSSVNCTWCTLNLNIKLCNTREAHIANGCDQHIVDPVSEITIAKNRPTADGQNAIQIQPQKIKLRVRPHETVEIPFQFYFAKDSPVDLYFLMDLSYTMAKYINQLAKVSLALVNDIQKLTGKLNVGIGSFIDKVLLPYTDTSEDAIKNPCFSQKLKCESPYNFKQVVKLTSQFQAFSDKVSQLQNLSSANLDNPEAGLEAMMQTIVCGDKIGWRNNSRKLIIYCSDASFHYAGDGKLGGLVLPNDGKCHLNNNKYTKAESQDYPSVGHLAEVIEQNKVTVIFAVAGKNQLNLYKKLQGSLSGAYVSKLDSKDYTIADIVKDNYANITSGVKIVSPNKNLNFTIMSKCKGTKWIASDSCDGIKPAQTVDFKVVLTAPDCSSARHQSIKINPVGLHDTLTIDMELICECDCEKYPETKSPLCSSAGNLTCGQCSCEPNRSGQNCSCSIQDFENDLINRCRPDNNSALCSQRGECNCGSCICQEMPSNPNYHYSGRFCECDDYSCPNYNNLLCGGPSHGSCKCGVCECKPEYTGMNCGCVKSTATCLSKNKKICNGHGTCKCGVCKCEENSNYTGKLCEDCPACLSKCSIYKECVKCVLNNNGVNSTDCFKICDYKLVTMVDTLDAANNDTKKKCTVELDECYVHYLIISDYDTDRIDVKKKQDCTELINITWLVVGIIGGILFIGLLVLIIWKGFTTYYDRREMARFESEQKKAQWHPQGNPIYHPASTTFENPVWGREK
ncbi:integrin beta-1-like isoform X2 [Octopus sinensis]|uniref:Integrin beta n=1 Tax=Octopus sinensis TaxID=2607531 RepID=A0A6P7TM12_9MOLL|nr:integrin beta-1-like isoform X2 [Octopus sinensis]